MSDLALYSGPTIREGVSPSYCFPLIMRSSSWNSVTNTITVQTNTMRQYITSLIHQSVEMNGTRSELSSYSVSCFQASITKLVCTIKTAFGILSPNAHVSQNCSWCTSPRKSMETIPARLFAIFLGRTEIWTCTMHHGPLMWAVLQEDSLQLLSQAPLPRVSFSCHRVWRDA